MRLAHLLCIASSLDTTFGWGWGFGSPRRVEGHDSQHVLKGSPPHSRPHGPLPNAFRLRPNIAPRNRAGFVALGDSYSAGIGTGQKPGDKEDDCRHGIGGHPALIAADLELSQGINTTTFQYLSCTGATTDQVLKGGEDSQMDAMNASVPLDFALLSLGGNDLGFFAVMNACIFRFYNFYSGNCEAELENARVQLQSPDFENRLAIVILEILDKVKWEKKPYFIVTVTGYTRFFNDETDECDDMSLGVWWRGPKLKKSVRLEMNALVMAVNAKIRRSVDMINKRFTRDKVLFVDYDKKFEGHRFCEPNVTEPDYNRTDTWFFLVGGPDNARNETQVIRAADKQLLEPTSLLVDPELCLGPAQKSGDWGLLALCYMAMAKRDDPTLRPASGEMMAQNSMWYVPTYYGKTFHPRTLGHEVIRQEIYNAWDEREEEL